VSNNLLLDYLGTLREASWRKKALLGLPLTLVLGGLLWLWLGDAGNSQAFRTVPVVRGDLQAVISATGTVEPEEVIDVGAQVAGRIVAFGKDRDGKTVDYGSQVEPGMVLAQIDDSVYAAEVAQAKAQLSQAKANVQRAEADLGQLKAKLYQAERDWQRAKKLGPSDALSQSDYDAALSAYEVAKANLNVGQAALLQAKEAVQQAEANLRKAMQNLDYTIIRSPVKGVIIDRRVNIGQTVVASLNAPSLFLIAKDLKRLQIWASVNEADIGNIRPGQPVVFTVDAHPGLTFQGEVGKIRLNATMTQNVVTYVVEVNFDNSDGTLIPYLTANLKFIVAERKNVLLVPNAALRWSPQVNQIAPQFRTQTHKGQRTGTEGLAATNLSSDKSGPSQGILWVPQGGYVKPVRVNLGVSDGSLTEVSGPDLKEGLQVVVAEQTKGAEAPDAASPFVPQPLRGRSSPGRPPH